MNDNNKENDLFQSEVYEELIFEIQPKLPIDYKIAYYIGGGSVGTVLAAKSEKENNTIVVKAVKTEGAKTLQNALYNECMLQKTLNHENIAQVFGCAFTPSFSFIFMELLSGGDLFDLIPQNEGLNIHTGIRIYTQILGALEFCHARQIAHLDVKPENVMMTATGVAKLIDFGLAIDHSKTEFLQRHVGTLCYSAPETFLRRPYQGFKADLFSLHVTLLTCLTGQRCWSQATVKDRMYGSWLDRDWDGCPVLQLLPTDMLGFLLVAMAHSPTDRLDANQMRQHAWFRAAVSGGGVRGLCRSASTADVAADATAASAGNGGHHSQPQRVLARLNCELSQEMQNTMTLSLPDKPSLLPMPNILNGRDQHIVRRMTRFFSRLSLPDTLSHVQVMLDQLQHSLLLRSNAGHFMMESSKSGFKVTFRVFVYRFADSVLVDMRRVRGDGLLFRQMFEQMAVCGRQLRMVDDEHPYLTKIIPPHTTQ